MAATLAVLKERVAGETRVAITPDAVKKYADMGLSVVIETGAGLGSSIPDADYSAAGAKIARSAKDALSGADLVLKVRGPQADEIAALKKGATVVALMDAYNNRAGVSALGRAGANAYAMEFVPRITRAQVMDALSSQANLAGYRAVIEASEAYGRALPMMMTAAGTVAAAKVFIMGVGVAGLQAIATARRLGAVVTATDVRPATKEQVESLGAKFLAVEDEEFKNAQTAGGYAKEMSKEYQAKQAELVSGHIAKQDIVITTALIPGRRAPILVSGAQVASMKPGSVLVDLAIEQGGNVEGARLGEVVSTANGAKIIGIPNLPARIAADASNLYARNLVAFVGLLVKDGALAPDAEDEILKAAQLTSGGSVVHPQLQGEAPAAPKAPAADKPVAKAPAKPKAETKLSVLPKEPKAPASKAAAAPKAKTAAKTKPAAEAVAKAAAAVESAVEAAVDAVAEPVAKAAKAIKKPAAPKVVATKPSPRPAAKKPAASTPAKKKPAASTPAKKK